MQNARTWRFVLAALTLAAAGNGLSAAGDPMAGAIYRDYPQMNITAPPEDLALDPFYRKYIDADGIPVTTSARVPDLALFVARDIVLAMLSERPDLRDHLIESGARVGIMAIDEGTTDLPEQRDWKKPAIDDPRLTPCERKNYDRIANMTDEEYWNKRARGMGGTYTTGAAENILGVPGTRYFGENILVHEFAHNILESIRESDPGLGARIERAYENAMAIGLWEGSYSSQNTHEYWAEGTQFWFNSNMAYKVGDIVIATAETMRDYDPTLYNVLDQVYRSDHRIPMDVFYRHPARMASAPADTGRRCE